MKNWVIANWKMHKLRADAEDFVELLSEKLSEVTWRSKVEIGIAPPTTLLGMCAERTEKMGWHIGAQNCHSQDHGAFTGEVSCAMIRDLGADFVLVGHSERRSLFGETDEVVQEKMVASAASGLTAVLCVGETLAERGQNQTFVVVERQLTVALEKQSDLKRVLIAYEPVWAIGTGRTATPTQAQEVHFFIREFIKRRFGGPSSEATPILYSGSVKPANFDELLAQKDVNGGLVGGASLDPADFSQLVRSASQP